jgi:hypothetical protein
MTFLSQSADYFGLEEIDTFLFGIEDIVAVLFSSFFSSKLSVYVTKATTIMVNQFEQVIIVVVTIIDKTLWLMDDLETFSDFLQ